MLAELLSDTPRDIATLTFDLTDDGPSRQYGLRPPSVHQV